MCALYLTEFLLLFLCLSTVSIVSSSVQCSTLSRLFHLVLKFVGNLLPCCPSMRLPYFKKTKKQGGNLWLSLDFQYGPYGLSNVTVTKDGYRFLRYEQDARYNGDITLSRLDFEDSGIYGWHIHLSASNSSNLLRTPVLSTYTVVTVTGNLLGLVITHYPLT